MLLHSKTGELRNLFSRIVLYPFCSSRCKVMLLNNRPSLRYVLKLSVPLVATSNPYLPPTLPALFIAADGEPFASDQAIAEGRQYVPSLEVMHVHAGHWIMQEKKREVEEIILDWLRDKVLTNV